MEVFISWSGEKSKKIGGILTNWIPLFLQSVKPYYTPDSIDKGKKWLTDITSKLVSCSAGIICLTADNLEKPWILFEAGALSSKLDDSKVCPIVFGIPKSAVKGPLTIFQVTEFTEEDFKKLIKSLNEELGPLKIPSSTIDMNFQAFFPKMLDEVKAILEEPSETPVPIKRTQEDLIEELVQNTRSLIQTSAETLSLLNANQHKSDMESYRKWITTNQLKRKSQPNAVSIFDLLKSTEGLVDPTVSSDTALPEDNTGDAAANK